MFRVPRFLTSPAALLFLLLFALATTSAFRPAPADAAPDYVEGEILIKFKPNAATADVQAILGDLGATRIQRFRRIHAERDRITRSVPDAIARYKNHPAVAFIEPNYIMQADAVPSDPSFPTQWSLQNTGQLGGTAGADIDAVAAWDLETGSAQVLVAVIDTGVDYTHPDLAGNIFENPGEVAGNGIDDDGNGFIDDVRGWDFLNGDNDPMDDNGHGTHVSGSIGARGNNAVGIAGVVWNVRILPLKFLGAGGSGPTSAAVECIEYATAMGARVMNNSWGGGGYSEALRQAIADAGSAGILFVAAAGNDGENNDLYPHYPSNYDLDNIIAVASTTRTDGLSGFSDYGVQTVDLGAPGSDIYSTVPGGYSSKSGTSMATPHVTGAVAMLESHFPNMAGLAAKTLILSSAEPIPALAGKVLTGGRLNVLRMLEGPDTIPPAPVADLAPVGASFDEIALAFTAPGDDGAQGTAAHYELRYSTSAIDPSNFGSATLATGLPAPHAAGTAEQLTVTGLVGNTRYYFALRAFDEYGNTSGLSNIVSAQTTGPPDIAVAPDSLHGALETGASGQLPFSIANDGEGTLVVSIGPEYASTPVTVHEAAALAKGEADTRPGVGGIQGFGGPDAFGYRWSDSDAPGGPPYLWEDISATGSPTGIYGDDVMSSAIPIGFAFPYYGNSFTQVYISSNGFLTFDPYAYPSFTNQMLPSTGAPHDMIAPLWDDLYVGAGSSVVWHSDGTRFIVQWTNVPYLGGTGGPYTFQVVLDRGGSILFRYQSLGSGLIGPTVGIQNGTGTDGLTAAFNVASYPHASLAIRFATVPPWLSAAPVTGGIPAGASMPFQAQVDASGLNGGPYEGRLRITSNDPDGSPVYLPVHLDVTGAPDIRVAPDQLAYGPVFIGAAPTQALHVRNAGFETLHVAAVSTDAAVYTVDGAAFDLAPSASRDLNVSFAPVVPGPATGHLTIQSDDPDHPTLVVPLDGEGLVPPDIAVSPSSLDAALFTGGAADRAVTIQNLGGSPLVWAAGVGLLSAASLHPYALAPAPLGAQAADGASADPGAGVARGDSLRASFADLTGIRILYDTAHGSAPPYSYWSTIIGNLTARGAQVVVNSSPITPDVLRDARVLWLTDMAASWSGSELTALRNWVTAGGAIVFEGDNGTTVPVYNAILAAIGLPQSYVASAGAEGSTSRIYPHPATQNVHSILLSANLARLASIGPQEKVLVEDVAGVPNTAAGTLGAGRVLLMADELFEDYRMSYGDNQLFANQAFDWLAGNRWLSVSPTYGTTPTGESATLTAHLDATGLATGTYDASIVTRSNDPDQPEVPVTVHLSVTGAPDVRVAPASLAFGSLFVGESRTDSIRVSNAGTEDLHVTSVAPGHPDFSVDVSAFVLGPSQSRLVHVTYVPVTLGSIAANLVLASDDPDQPEATVALGAMALPPPDVDVAPASFDEALNTGGTLTRQLTVANVSGSPLQFSIRIQDTTGGAGAPAGPGAADATSEPWAALRSRLLADTSRSNLAPSIASNLELPVVIEDPPGDGGPVDLRYLRASGRGGFIEIELETAANVQPYDFAGVVSLDTDRNRLTGRRPSYGTPGQDIGAEYEFFLFSVAYGYVDLYDAVSGSYRGSFPVTVTGNRLRFAAPLSALGNDDGSMDVTGVIGTAYGPTDWFPDAGHGTIGGWISADPVAGTVPAGTTQPVTLTFNARDLDGGDYTADVIVATNDPDESEIRVPARLRVTGVPILSLAPTTLAFDSLFVGLTAVREVLVGNVGSATLSVTEVAFDSPEFRGDATSFALAPRTSRRLRITFAPQSPGDKSAAMLLTHNADGSPSTVALTGVAVTPPSIVVEPDAFAVSIETNQQASQTLRIRNSGGSDLHYEVSLLEGAANVTVSEALDLPHGASDPRVGDPVTEGAGGPDRFGYRWRDSGETGGPAFDWVEIRDIGTHIPMRELDENVGPLPIGFAFPFYGGTFTQFRACTHGWISFTSPAIQWTNQPLPSQGAPENLIAMFWEDQNFSGTEHAYYHNDGTRLIIEYENVPRTGGGGPYTYEAILYPSGAIVFQYLRMNPPTNGATIGIQNATRDDGLTVVFNAAYVRDNLAIRLSPAPSWLLAAPLAGSVPPGGDAPLQVTADATGLFPGDYAGRIDLASNDPARRRVTVPASMHVIGVPDLQLSPPSLTFDTIFTGDTQTRALRFTNAGTDALEVTGLSFGLPDFSADVAAFTLAPLQSRLVTIRFAPSVGGDRSATLEIASNDPDSPLRVPIHAAALVPPVLELAPPQLVAAAAPGGEKLKVFRVGNTGGSDLRWSSGVVLSGVTAYPAVENAKGADDTRPGILGAGGPDAFGNIWADSDEPGGPAYEWFDIGAVGTTVPFSSAADDENRGPYPIGFEFPFYGNTFEEFRVCTNGWISFTNAYGSYDNQPLPCPYAGVPENLIAALWDDLALDPASQSRVLYWSDAERLIVQYDHVQRLGAFSATPFDFQIELRPSGAVVLRYKSLGTLLTSATIGIQNAQRNDGLTVAFNAAYLHPGLAVQFTTRSHWLSIAPPSGTVPPGGSMDVTARFDASLLEAGDYTGGIGIQTNERGGPTHTQPCLFHVGITEAVAASVEPNTLNLDSRGQWVIGQIELPGTLDPNRVLLSTVRMLGTIAAESVLVADFNANGIPDLEFRFPRDEVELRLPEGPRVPVAITGEVEDLTIFSGCDSVRAIRPRVTAPNGGEVWLAGTVHDVQWQNPPGWRVDDATLFWSPNGGGTWSLLADHVAGTTYSWTLPAPSSANVVVRVYVSDSTGVMGFDSSDKPFAILNQITGVETEEAAPAVHELYGNVPNPFNPSTAIRFDLPVAGDVALNVFDAKGRLVRTLVDQVLPAGRHRVLWDGRNESRAEVGSGVYFYRIEVTGSVPFEKSRRMVLVR